MFEYDKDHSAEHERHEKDWNGIIIRHSTAWFLLLIVMVVIWKMTQPVMVLRQIGDASMRESTATGTPAVSREAAVSTTNVAGVTTTTMIPEKTTTTTEPPPTGEIKVLSGRDRVQVLADALLLREGPSTRSKVKARLGKGTIVAVEERVNGWMKVRTVNDEIGYVSGRAGLTRTAP
ncbi:MAG: SH3 domain-containing protein [Actinobacteria bacterium]|nr:SH3 domain-containing protein [Actinomycetota bacterium]